jgi:hypothetical protein
MGSIIGHGWRRKQVWGDIPDEPESLQNIAAGEK